MGLRILSIFILHLILLCCCKIHAQNVSVNPISFKYSEINKDSVLKRVEYCLNVYNNHSLLDSNLSRTYNQIALALLKSSTEADIKSKLYLLIIRNDIVTGKDYNTFLIKNEAIQWIEIHGDLKQKSKINYYVAFYFSEKKHNYKKATIFFYRALKFAEKSKDDILIAHTTSAIGKLFQVTNNNDSAFTYYKKSMNCFEKRHDTLNIAISYLNMGATRLKDKVLRDEYCNQALNYAVLSKAENVEMTILYNIANFIYTDGELEDAEFKTSELIRKAEKNNQTDMLLNSKALLASIKSDLNKYDESIKISLEILPEFKNQNNILFVISVLDILEKNYFQKNNYQKAYYYAKEKKQINDSFTKSNNNSYLEEIKGKYNLEKKDEELKLKNEILVQKEKTEKQKNIIILALTLALISAVAFFFVFFKQRKSKIEIIQKEKEYNTQLQNFESFINGQETERQRIASDLHDGLAQNLVMLNLELSVLKDNNSIQRIDFMQKEVNKMIDETRKIAHNMMPDVLIDLGLQKALKSLISKLTETIPTIKFTLSIIEPFNNIDKNTEVQLYRMTQELINNTIKHSGATECYVILESNFDTIKLIVQDNGKGILSHNETTDNGIGFRNLYTRTHSLHGQLTINSPQGKGVVISIDIPSKNNTNG